MIATAPMFPAASERRPAALPAPTEAMAVWASIIVLLLAFWYGVGVGVNVLWGHFAG